MDASDALFDGYVHVPCLVPATSTPVKLPPLNLYWSSERHPGDAMDAYDATYDALDDDDVFSAVYGDLIVPHAASLLSDLEALDSPDFYSASSASSASSAASDGGAYGHFPFPPEPWMMASVDDGSATPSTPSTPTTPSTPSTPELLECRWVDCKGVFCSQEALVTHIERCHVDVRRADDFTCFWAGCPRRHRPFNARYKLLIHMRVHSGEKPNRCSVIYSEIISISFINFIHQFINLSIHSNANFSDFIWNFYSV